MKTFRLFIPAAVAAVSAFLLPPSVFGQGSLTPPGPPSPTMKKLDEIEPRTNLQATPAPTGVDTGNADYQFIITQPGSYYLSANLVVTKTNGIQINAEGVTLDLNGFQVSRPTPSGIGIEISAAGHRAVVRNGSVKGFLFGIAGNARAGAFQDLAVSGCTQHGIITSTGAVLESCRAHDNSGITAIYAGQGSTLNNCTATGNTTSVAIAASASCTLTKCAAFSNAAVWGISVYAGSTLTNCSASYNTGSDPTSAGFNIGPGSTVAHCSAYSNNTTGAPTATTGIGFNVSDNSTILNCDAQLNRGDGIRAAYACVIRENNCSLNGNGAGVHTTGGNNRIEGNNVTSNYRGIQVDGTGSLIIKNSASDNSSDYLIGASNRYGPVVDISAGGAPAVNGKSAADTSTTSHPWANFSY